MTDSVMRDDPVTFEVIRGGLYGICEEMKAVMTRAAFSPLLSLSADLSCALLDRDGDVVAQGDDIPVHLGAMPFSARGILERFPAEGWRPGDVVLANDPYSGGSHLPDMTMLTGIFGDGEVIGFAASRVHWPDIGGAAPGSSSVTDEIIKEGLRLPPVRIVHAGETDQGLFDVLFANVRVPRDRIGDFHAQIGCNRRGVERVESLVTRYGAATVRAVFKEAQDYSAARAAVLLDRLPGGVYSAAHHLDGDGYVEDHGNGPLVIAVTITSRDGTLTFDFAGTGAQAAGPINAPLAVTASACYYTVMAICGGEVPPNSGAYRAARIEAPEGTLVNARHPAPVVAANTEMSTRLVDLLLDALAPALGEDAVAGSYGCAGIWTIGGFDPLRGRRFVHCECVGGGMGASRRGPGLDGHRVHMGNTMNLPVEAVEATLPVRIDEYALIDSSGGAGAHRGGMGSRRIVRALADDVSFSLLFERAYHPAPGIAGGGPGRAARFLLEKPDETLVLGSKTQVGKMNAGDRVHIETAGGGGWGEPGADDR